MANYFHVETGRIKDGPRELPTAWRNVSGLHLLDAAALAAHGGLLEEKVGFEPFDPATQVRAGPVHAIQADKVVSTYTVRAKTARERDGDKDATLAGGFEADAFKALEGFLADKFTMTPAEVRAAVKAKMP